MKRSLDPKTMRACHLEVFRRMLATSPESAEVMAGELFCEIQDHLETICLLREENHDLRMELIDLRLRTIYSERPKTRRWFKWF